MPTHRCCLRTSGPEATQRAAQQLELGPSAKWGGRYPAPPSLFPHLLPLCGLRPLLHGQNGPPCPPPQPLSPCPVPLQRFSVPPSPEHVSRARPVQLQQSPLPSASGLAPMATSVYIAARERPVDQTCLLMVPLCFKPSQHQRNTTLAQVSIAWSTPDSPATLNSR